VNGPVVVWALQGEPPSDAGDVLLWLGYAEGSGVQSVPRYLEEHAKRLRSRYLEFIHDLGERKINGKSVVEHLDLGDGFSFWWMTRLAEKSPFKSPQLYDCLRLMALEEILVERRPSRLVLHGATRNLAEAIETLCRNLEIGFVWHSASPEKRQWSLRGIYLALPQAVQGLISLRHPVMNWPLRRLERPRWFADRKAIFLCSYFFNLDSASCSEGSFHSNQWGCMPAYLKQGGRHANWIHHFLRSPDDRDIHARTQWLSSFNRDSLNQGCHSLLESYLSWAVVGRALWKWLRLNAIALRLRNARGMFNPRDSAASLWPLLRTDWRASLRGPAALSNCLWVELFDAVLQDIPHQPTGLYLWENQGWECALLRAWRRHGHGRIIGVPHATVVFWHLNNFDDPRTLAPVARCSKPLPDHLAINGPMAWRTFDAAANVSPGRFVEVEALRFQYLAEPGLGPTGTGSSSRQGRALPVDGQRRKVLILGDFTEKQTLKMLSCMEEALRLSRADVSLVFKPHPVSRIRQQDYPSLPFEATSSALAEILPTCDLVFSSNTTSAGLEALLAGLPVLVFLDEEDFNHSPLRGVEGVRFVGTAVELAAALDSVWRSATAPAPDEFFWLDPEMPRWGKLLAAERGG
jgi:surface carbohydrate biosynthesis protein (TIGR04326 family)